MRATMDQALVALETEIQSLENQAAAADRLATEASAEYDANSHARVAASLRASAESLRRILDRIRALG